MWRRILMLLSVVLMLGGCAQTGTGMFRPDLNDDIIGRLALGQSESEVTALLGAPYQRIRFDNLKATAWDYVYKDTWGYWVDFSVMVGDDGRVVNKVSRRIDTGDRR
jgi:outer membrane protein assembly factor BamE (lipoprotein component of BamABCDE complex)